MSERPSDAWLERSRLDGMILDGFTYGIFFILSWQAIYALIPGVRSRSGGKITKRYAWILIGYVVITFILGTIGVATNWRYTEDIWINLRGERTPEDLIPNEFDFWYNRMAIDSQEVMVWIMNALLLHRVFIVWNYEIWVVVLMTSVYLSIVALATAVMVFTGRSVVFYDIRIQIAWLAMGCAFNFLFTILVASRLLMARKRVKDVLGPQHAATYTSVTATLVESTALYFVFDVIFLFTFAFHSNVQNLILLENCLIQGISQLLIILRVANSRDIEMTIATATSQRKAASNGSLVFAGNKSTGRPVGSTNVELTSITAGNSVSTQARDYHAAKVMYSAQLEQDEDKATYQV